MLIRLATNICRPIKNDCRFDPANMRLQLTEATLYGAGSSLGILSREKAVICIPSIIPTMANNTKKMMTKTVLGMPFHIPQLPSNSALIVTANANSKMDSENSSRPQKNMFCAELREGSCEWRGTPII
jgi:hypothetical protein